jgi:hypothetical protein
VELVVVGSDAVLGVEVEVDEELYPKEERKDDMDWDRSEYLDDESVAMFFVCK